MKKLYRGFCKLEEIISCVFFFSMVLLVFLSAIARLIQHPLAWSIDVSQLLLAWTAFLGADVAFRRGKLVGLDLLTRKMPHRVQDGLTLVIQVLILIAFIIFIIFGFRLSADSWKRAFQTLPISYSYVTLSLPVSSVFMTVTAILKIRETMKRLTGRGAAGMEGGNA